MPVTIPVTDDAARRIRADVGPERFVFRTCFTGSHWLLDVFDDQERPLIAGINLVPGVDNLLKGHGNVLDGYALRVAVEEGATGREADAPGNAMHLVWFNPGEENPFASGDPMDTVGEDLWSWPDL